MKPCYLNAGAGMQVQLDGPTLSVTQPACARRLLPVVRISRLVVSGSVEFSTAALLLCADRGITVTFLDTNGRIRASLFGDSIRRTDLCQRLRDFLDFPDWPEHYEDWLRSMESLIHRNTCRRLGLAPEFTSFKSANTRIEELQNRWLGVKHRGHVAGRLAGMAAALAAERLSEAGLGAVQLASLDPRLRLTYYLARWMILDLRVSVVNWTKHREADTPVIDRELAEFFEARSPRLTHLAHAILNRLQRFLAGF